MSEKFDQNSTEETPFEEIHINLVHLKGELTNVRKI